jgi:hypothetical protein
VQREVVGAFAQRRQLRRVNDLHQQQTNKRSSDESKQTHKKPNKKTHKQPNRTRTDALRTQ